MAMSGYARQSKAGQVKARPGKPWIGKEKRG
jgi:hypothetical protein